jgi:hypothetical protein
MTWFVRCITCVPLVLLVTLALARTVEAPNDESIFQDATAKAGLSVTLQNSATTQKHQIETMAGGVAVFDYNNDGYPDIYFTNGAEQPSLKKSDPKYYNRLYRNRGDGTFEDVTEKAGVKGTGYNFGVAAGDFDNDGNEDLFVTGVRGNTLFRNRGDDTFEDVTAKAGIAGEDWSIGAAWLDYDNDGLLDLFVVEYVKWDPATEPYCGDASHNLRTYCHPRFYGALANRLYRNNGNGTFTDVSVPSGIAEHLGKGMGVAIGDYDHDGRMDIFVANDTLPNFLFHNEGNGHFSEVALQTGVGLNDDGKAISSMGVDFRDLNNDGREDLFVTALAGETFPYFRSYRTGLFMDMTYPSGIGPATMLLSGWGVGAYDFDNDGWKDIFVANGDVQDNTEQYSSRKSRQQNLLLTNDRAGGFRAQLLGKPAFYRGAAFADFDRDGRVDTVVTRLGENPVLLRNVSATRNHWLTLKLIGTKSNRDGIGALVTVSAAGRRQINRVTTAVGYASSSDLAVHFGLGSCARVDQLDVEWPSGIRQSVKDIQADRYLTLRERP